MYEVLYGSVIYCMFESHIIYIPMTTVVESKFGMLDCTSLHVPELTDT